jgi:hypothetical protein
MVKASALDTDAERDVAGSAGRSRKHGAVLDIDDSIDALSDALVAIGVDAPQAPTDVAVLEEIAAAIDPLRLPAEVGRFWERIDPATIRALTFPELCPPQFALQSCTSNREHGFNNPEVLFLVAYTSHCCMSVELDGPSGGGGTLFRWNVVDGSYQLSYDSLAAWLAHTAALIGAGSYERSESERGTWLSITDPREEVPVAAREPSTLSHPVYGEATAVPRDPVLWPAHWQRASGLEPADISPRGATHTIAEVLGSDPARALRATVAGRVINLMGQIDTRVRVTDGTETIDIHCPAAVTLLGPVVGCEFEFDVVISPGPRRPASASAVEPDDPTDELAVLTATLMSRYGDPAGATATAVRPCGPAQD